MPTGDQMTSATSPSKNALAVFRYQRHTIATELIPEMDAIALAALAANITTDGLDFPIVLFEGKVLDGWARYHACLASGIEPTFRRFDVNREGDPQAFVLRQAILRKHFGKPQKAMIAARLVTSWIGFNQTDKGTTIVAAALEANVDKRMVDRALKIKRKSAIVADAVANGRIPSIRVADRFCELPLSVQQTVLAKGSRGPALKKEIQTAFRDWKKAQPVLLPEGLFSVIVADPPWPVDKTPYPTMRHDEIEDELRRLLEEKAADDCYLFLWTTQANLPSAFQLIERLSWAYKFKMTWHKANGPQNPSGPMYNDEPVIVATKGSPSFTDIRRFKTCFEGKQRRHSEKPDEFFAMIKRVTAGPRLELFARRPHDGFEPHGNEIDWSERTESPSVNARSISSGICAWSTALMEEWCIETNMAALVAQAEASS